MITLYPALPKVTLYAALLCGRPIPRPRRSFTALVERRGTSPLGLVRQERLPRVSFYPGQAVVEVDALDEAGICGLPAPEQLDVLAQEV